MHIKLVICHWEVNPKDPKHPKHVCIKVDTTVPDLPTQPKNPFPVPSNPVIIPALKNAKEKGLSSNAEKDIHTLAKFAAQSSDIQNPALQREFAVFARNAIKHIKLPEGITLDIEEA